MPLDVRTFNFKQNLIGSGIPSFVAQRVKSQGQSNGSTHAKDKQWTLTEMQRVSNSVFNTVEVVKNGS